MISKLNNKYLKYCLYLMIAVCLPIFMEMYFLIIETALSPNALFGVDFLQNLFLLVKVKRLIILYLLTIGILLCINRFTAKRVFNFIYEHRYGIGGGFFLVCVLGEIHGSSIEYWQYLFQGSETFKTLIGVSRSVRSDEWAVNTPMMISQYFNHSGAFPYFSETIRGALTDVFIVYGQPVRTILEVFRPFHWGFLVLPPAKGLSFFWMGRLLALFFVSLEFGMIFCKKNRILAVTYGVLITWAPIIQWWFAVNGLVEMLIFGQLAVVMIDSYLQTKKYRLRILFAVVLLICTIGYLLTFYPAWQIPLAYVFGLLLVGTVFENRQDIFLGKKDAMILVTFCFAFFGIMGYILSISYDTILAVSQTVYPGERFETGGGQLYRYFLYPGNLFFPLSRPLPFSNVCELSVFFDFFPAGILLSFWVLLKEKKWDGYLLSLLAGFGILSAYCLTTWPDWLAKISLLSHAQPFRVFLAIGFINILMLLRALCLMEEEIPRWLKIAAALLLGFSIALGSTDFYEGYLDHRMFVLIFVLLALSFYVLLGGGKSFAQKFFLAITLGIAFVSGMFVNPVVSGLDVIFKQPLIQAIAEITESSDKLWIVDSEQGGYPLINVPIMAGAPTINSTNVYPNLERWHLLDPDGSEERIYNRYAHITVNLVRASENSQFILDSADLITIRLSTADLEKLAVGYVLSTRNLTVFSDEMVKFVPLENINGYTIYEIEYNKN
jgi:hypothetical protein